MKLELEEAFDVELDGWFSIKQRLNASIYLPRELQLCFHSFWDLLVILTGVIRYGSSKASGCVLHTVRDVAERKEPRHYSMENRN